MGEQMTEPIPTGPTIDRTTYLGASEIAAVAGVSPYSSPLDVWASKKGLAGLPESAAMRAGTELERPILERLYAPQHQVILTYPGTMRHPIESWMAATPDALAEDSQGKWADVQCKLVGHRQAHRWDDSSEGRDGIPPEVLCQVTWEMACAGLEDADVVALLGTELRVYPIELDADFLADLVAIGRQFWEDKVQADVMPDVTATSRRVLERYFGKEATGMADATEAGKQLARDYVAASQAVKAAEYEKDRLGNELRKMIGEATGFEGDFGKATWKSQKGRIDYKDAAEEFAIRLELESWQDSYRSKPTRVLRVNLKGE